MLHRNITTVTRMPEWALQQPSASEPPDYKQMMGEYEDITRFQWPKKWTTPVSLLSWLHCHIIEMYSRKAFHMSTNTSRGIAKSCLRSTLRSTTGQLNPSVKTLRKLWEADCRCCSRVLMVLATRRQDPITFENPRVAMISTRCSTRSL